MKKLWKVQEFLEKDEDDEETSLELSVIRTDNQYGQKSWGWGGEDKIILFGTGMGENQIDPSDEESLDFARKCAKILCDGLNSQYKKVVGPFGRW